jgi:hypothetical protein
MEKKMNSHLKQTQCHGNLTPRLIDSNMYSDVTSNVRSKKNAPNSIVAAKVEVLLKRLLYTLLTPPAILLPHGSDLVIRDLHDLQTDLYSPLHKILSRIIVHS